MKTATKKRTQNGATNGHAANGSAPQTASNNLYEREDLALFRTVRTLSQESGVPPERLRRLVVKEAADNALDICGTCRIGKLPDGGYFIDDDGPGIPGEPEEIAWLFSFGRPLASSKMIRKPSRGALGNGNRVIAGAVFASDGSLRVTTRGREIFLSPQESGSTRVDKVKPSKRQTGTRVEVRLGAGVPEDVFALKWAQNAIEAAGKKPIYDGKTSPWWYDSDSFFELCKAAGPRTVQQVMQEFDGSDDLKIPKRLTARTAASLTDKEAEELLGLAREQDYPISPKRFSLLRKALPGHYANTLSYLELKPGRGNLAAELPYTVEAWVSPSAAQDGVSVLVNRTPVTGQLSIQRSDKKANVTIFGCNLGYDFTVGRKPVYITINVQIPYMPITSNGKEPDLDPFIDEIREVVEKAAKKCQRANPSSADRSGGFLPSTKKGRPSDEGRAQYQQNLQAFADYLKEMNSRVDLKMKEMNNSRVDFKISARGLCYVLENEGKVSKGEFDRAQNLITECRETGLLPIDFTAEDESRTADNLEVCDLMDAGQYIASRAEAIPDWWKHYTPVTFWDNQSAYIQMVVEKIDLKSLFLPVCQQYCVPIINARGWSDLNLRACLMRRFQEHERKGRRPILLYCGDHDPVGLQIADLWRRHLTRLEKAVGWSPRDLTIERFGLNKDFIDKHGLTRIDGLTTGSGKDLGDPRHPQHKAEFVQSYIRQFGKQKVEANALVVRPDAGQRLCRDAIEKRLDLSAIANYQRALQERRHEALLAMPDAVAPVLEALREAAKSRHGGGES